MRPQELPVAPQLELPELLDDEVIDRRDYALAEEQAPVNRRRLWRHPAHSALGVRKTVEVIRCGTGRPFFVADRESERKS